MCGIIGYKGNGNAIPLVIHGLKNLEYRGYDSSGIAYFKDHKINIYKKEGKIVNLEEILPNDSSNLAIGHTRWATHGVANTINAHPHKQGSITLVHNGIIENYRELKEMLETNGYHFVSDTDTEIVAGLIDYYYHEENDMVKALTRLKLIVRGSYALGILVDGDERLYATRLKSPLIVGVGEDGLYIASDVPAILDYTKNYFLLDDYDICVIDNDYKVYNNRKLVNKEILTFNDSIGSAQKDGYEHFMLKEIHEQPKVVENLISLILNTDTIKLSDYDNIQIVGCGSAYHAALVGKYIIEKYLNIKVECFIASEYRYGKIFKTDKTLFIAISQSGETADTLASTLIAKEHGMHTLGIINTQGSSIARECDEVLYINAGIECAVATTKAYSLQVLMFSLLVYKEINDKDILLEYQRLPDELKKILDIDYHNIVKKIYRYEDIFFIGRQNDYALCMEGSLKLKEISYLHSEAYAAGELKHGTISLIEDGTPVIAIVTDPDIAEKTISNIKETKARGAFVLLIIREDIDVNSDVYDYLIKVPKYSIFANSLLVIEILQMIAYYVALSRGCDIDKPRNLAKSVTVE